MNEHESLEQDALFRGLAAVLGEAERLVAKGEELAQGQPHIIMMTITCRGSADVGGSAHLIASDPGSPRGTVRGSAGGWVTILISARVVRDYLVRVREAGGES